MKKIASFIVDKRHFILIFFIVLTIVAGIASKNVVINHDINKYLPTTSETRKGLDIMENEFKELDTSTFNIMIKGLESNKKSEVYDYIKDVEGVNSVEYDETEKYNKDDYTLYGVNISDKADSETATKVFSDITEKYKKDYEVYTSGEVAEKNNPVLEFWIIVLAVACALVILIIMCESYVEPFLFLTVILMAVVLNKGTNLIFSSVSYITEAIAAILQLALSMDYSIMLMNRYNQEKEKNNNKVEAMKEALYNAFTSISSSSVTTIVGLLALVFMSFTIGRDLGFVLAKGVLFSLITILFVLPSFILLFDKWITKTKKRVPKIRMDLIGKIAYKCRYISIPLFLIVFIASYCLKGNLNILYTGTQQDKIASVFTENNQIAIVYNKEDEEKIAKILPEIENESKVKQVLGYSNTINQKLAYNELIPKLNDLSTEIEVEDYLLKILYYNYYNKNINNTMTFNEFVQFIKTKVYNNPKINEKIDNGTRDNLDRLENFTTENLMNAERSSSEIAKILEIDESKVKDILVYYSSRNDTTTITINNFVNFINNYVINDSKYASSLDNTSRENLKTLSNYIDKNKIQTKMTASKIAQLFEMDENIVNSLFTYYISVNEIDTKLSLNNFANFVLNDVIKNPQYSNLLDQPTLESLYLLQTLSNRNLINTSMTAEQLSNMFGIQEGLIEKVLLLKYSSLEDGTISTNNYNATPYEFINIMIENASNPAMSMYLTPEIINQIRLASAIMESTQNNIQYSYEELANFTGVDVQLVKNIYTLYTSINTQVKLTPLEFLDFVLEHKNDEILSNRLSENIENNLKLVQQVMQGIIDNKKYSHQELASLLGINDEKVQLLYGLYNSKYINTNRTISLKEFISFLLNDVVNNPSFASNFDDNMIQKLNTVNSIMHASINGTKYTSNEIMDIISIFTDSIEKDLIDLLYMYYGSENEYNPEWKITIEEFIRYLNEDILTDNRFDEFITDDIRNKIIDAKKTINDAKDLLISNNHARVIINSRLDPESIETFEFIQKLKDLCNENSIKAYVAGNSPMAYEMTSLFNDELNFISVLTMIAIFIVVALTFKSILVPIILVFIIQCAVYTTMGILSFSGEGVYFIALLIVQSILMGATIDYAIVYTSYYLEHRKTLDVKESIKNAYNNSVNTILTSASILIIVTLIVANFASEIAGQICKTVSEGTLCSAILILVLLPAILACSDKIITRKITTKK